MRRETFESHSSEPAEEFKAEAKDNVREFISKEKPAQHAFEYILNEAGAHDSAVLLSDLELKQAEDELVALKDQQEQIKSSSYKNIRFLGLGKEKIRDLNKGLSVKNLPEISQKIHKLESNIALTKARPEVSEPMSKEEYNNLSPLGKALDALPNKDLDIDKARLDAFRNELDDLKLHWGQVIKEGFKQGPLRGPQQVMDKVAEFKTRTKFLQEQIDFLSPRVKTALTVKQNQDVKEMSITETPSSTEQQPLDKAA